MKNYSAHVLGAIAVWCGCAFLATSNFGQEDELPNQIDANRRLLPNMGPGLRAVRVGADGRTYVLASPTPGLVVFDRQSKPIITIGSPASPAKDARMPITFGEDCDVDAQGTMYVADRGANLIQVFSPDGELVRSIPINAPIAVAALPDGEVAVSTLHEPKLVVVFGKNGHVAREFGDPEQISDREDLNRFLNIGKLASDLQGHLYYAFEYMPEPTVRQFDRLGYAAGQDVQYTAVDAYPEAQAIRREIVQQGKRSKPPTFKRVLTAVGVDPTTGEIWMGVGNNLLRFDKEGNRRDTYQLYTPDGARLAINTILITKDHMLIGNDPLGIYEFNRPDKKSAS
jgi:hypothetical protein